MSQGDSCLVSDILVPEVGNESENLGRDLVDWCERVPPESDQGEDFGSVLLKSVDLQEATL